MPKWFWQQEKSHEEGELGKPHLGPYQDESWAADQRADHTPGDPAELSADSCTHELDGRSHLTPELNGDGGRG